MVEELKLAIKIDDASIEQSLLKQFANAQKMADKVVLDFRNVNFDDKQIEAKFKEMQKKAGQNPIDLTISDNALDMLGQIDKRLTEIFSIGKGKSFIDSSSITADIRKIENKINELNKKINTSFDTKNKTEAYNQLKKYADAFKDYYNNEEAMASESGTKAAYAYYKAYEEALKKEVAQSKLEKVTVDFDINDKFLDKNRIVSDRIKEYANYKKYGNDNDLLEEISSLKNKLFDFNSAYSQVKEKLGQAAITPEIIKSVERYVELLDKARFLEQLNDPDDNDTIKSHRAMAQVSLDDALFNAQEQSNKYTESLRQQEEQITSTVEAEQKLAEVQKETTSNSVTSDNSQIEELKSDIQEVKTELGDVKDRISSIESNGFENVREDVEKTKESVKELNGELTEMKSNISSTPQESNISSRDSSATSAVEQQKKDTSDIIKLTDNYGRELDEANSKLLKGTALLDEQGKLIRLYHGSDTEFDKFDLSRSNNQNNQIYGKGAYLIESEKGAEGYGSVVTQWYANVRKVMNEEGQLTLEEAQKLYNEFGKRLLNIFGKQMDFNEFFDAYIKFNPEETTVVEKMKSLANHLGKDIGDLFQTIGYDAIKMDRSNGSFYTIFDPDRLIRFKEAAVETTSAVEKLGASASQNPTKDAFPDKDISASVDSATNSIKEENNVLEQNTQKVKENTQAKEQNANVNFNKYDKRLDSYNGKIDKYKTTIDRFNDGGWTSDEYLKNVQAVKDAVKEYETLLNELKGKDASLVTSDDINRLDNYEKKIKDTIATVTNMSAAEKGYNFVSGQKELDKIHKLLNENSKMSSEAKAKIRAYYTEIESGNPSMSLDRIHGEIMKIYNAEVEAGRAGRSFFDTLKNSGFHKLAAQMSGMFGFYDVINIGKQAISTIVSLDDALLDLKKTTSMSSTELNNFYYSANDVAKQMGVTTKSIIEQASAWSRLGYSSNEQATEMAKLSSKFASISPGMDTDQAQEGMVSIMKAWQINPEDVEKEILDPINQLGNKFAESNNDIVEGMKRSAAALAAVGTDYKDAYSLFTGVQEVLQNSEVAGRALRSISMRIRGYDENSEDGFEQTDDELKNITGDLIDLTKTAQHAQGVSIFKEGSTTEFKSLVDYFGEIHDIWDEMSQKQQNDFLQKAFGKTQAQAGAALIQNYDAVKEALAEIDESAGSADKEMSTVEQTLSYKINALKETWVGCAQQILDRGDLGIAISGLNGVSKVITGLIDNVGLLKTAAMGVAATLSFKNVGGNKMHFPMNILDNIHNLLWIQRFRVCYP